MNNKQILFISPQSFFAYRGSPIRVKHDLIALSKLGYKIDLLTLAFGENIEIDGVRIIRIGTLFNIKSISIGPSFTKFMFDFILLFKAFKLLKKEDYFAIHGIEDGGLIAVILAKYFKIKSIYEKHSDISSHNKGILRTILLKIYSFLEINISGYSDAIICTGQGTFLQVSKKLSHNSIHNISDLPSSFTNPDNSEIEKYKNELKINPKNIVICFVGSSAKYQGIETLIESIKIVLQKQKNAKYIHIGKIDSVISKWNKYLEKNCDSNQYSFIGLKSPEETSSILAASDILLSTRIKGANSPLKLIDYLKAGKAIVATDSIANKVLLNDSISVITKSNPIEFSNGIISLIEDKEKRLKLSENAKKEYLKNHSYSLFEDKLKSCYNSLKSKN